MERVFKIIVEPGEVLAYGPDGYTHGPIPRSRCWVEHVVDSRGERLVARLGTPSRVVAIREITRQPQRSGFVATVGPFSGETPLAEVYGIGQALDLAERRLRERSR